MLSLLQGVLRVRRDVQSQAGAFDGSDDFDRSLHKLLLLISDHQGLVQKEIYSLLEKMDQIQLSLIDSSENSEKDIKCATKGLDSHREALDEMEMLMRLVEGSFVDVCSMHFSAFLY